MHNVQSINFQCFVQWLEDDFIGYLDHWETSVRERPGFSRAEQNYTCC